VWCVVLSDHVNTEEHCNSPQLLGFSHFRSPKVSEDPAQVLEEFRPYLLAIAMAELPEAIRSKIGASDIVQETIIKGFENHSQFRGTTREELACWLRAILFNLISNHQKAYRAQKRDMSLETPANDRQGISIQASPSQIALTQDEWARLESALLKLPVTYREVILMRHRENLSFPEIGCRIQKTEDAARKTWTRAIKQLKQELRVDESTAS